MLSNSFPDATVIGMTSDVMYSPKGITRTGLSVMAITSQIKVASGVVFEISRYPRRTADSITAALSGIEKENTVCFEFNASAGSCEELVMDTFHEVMGDSGIPMCGCSGAAAHNPDRPAAVSLNGILYSDACVFAFIHNEAGRIGIVKEIMFKQTRHFFTATDVDCDERRVYEFDHKSATSVMANALAIPEEELASNAFYHPLGRPMGDDIDVIGVGGTNKDGSVDFFTRIYNQTRVALLEPKENLPDVWKETSESIHEVVGQPSFSIVINCFLRTKFFIENNRFEEYNNALTSEYKDYIGFSGYGEQYMYRHLNQVMLIVAFE